MTLAQNSGTPPGGGGGTEPPKDNNPANPSNWEKVVSTTGLISAFSYPSLNVNTQNLAVPLAPEITDIQSWMNYSAYWDLPNGVRNFRLKWVGVGPAPSSVRVQNKGKLTAHFSGPFDLTQSFTGLDNTFDASTSVDHILKGEDYKNVSVDTLYQIGFKMKGTITGHGTTGRFGYEVSSALAELATALRPEAGDTYHKLGNGPYRELNTGEDYSNWVMDTIAAPTTSGNFFASILVNNSLSGPWNNPSFTYSAPGEGSYWDTPPATINAKLVKFPYTNEQWVGLSTAPEEKTVTVVIKDTTLSDAPERTARLRIKIHNPDENWRKNTHPDGSPYETIVKKDPEEIQFDNGKSTTIHGDSIGVTFKAWYSYPVLTHVNDAISGNALLQALLNFAPSKFALLANAAQVTVGLVKGAEQAQGPYGAIFDEQWDNTFSDFKPDKDPSKKEFYTMTASMVFFYNSTIWRSDGYGFDGYTGPNGANVEKKIDGGYVFGLFKRDGSPGGPPQPGSPGGSSAGGN